MPLPFAARLRSRSPKLFGFFLRSIHRHVFEREYTERRILEDHRNHLRRLTTKPEHIRQLRQTILVASCPARGAWTLGPTYSVLSLTGLAATSNSPLKA